MTIRDRDPDELLAPADDEERAEGDWLLARDADPAAAPPSPELAREHEQLAELLATLPVGQDDDRWKDELLAAAHADDAKRAPPPRRHRWPQLVAGAGVIAAGAIVLIVVTWPKPAVTELDVRAERDHRVRGGVDEVAVGDHLIVRARPAADGELRVYEGDHHLLLRCPGAPGCAAGAHRWKVDLVVTAPVVHHIVLAAGAVPAAADAGFGDYVKAAHDAGVRIRIQPPIDVH
ncbi:MAG TPA: hypothetical protein VHE35_04615 [Kofleriaceae bacterium]|nr:hypothetical protein [Kofleriaceae bacterium]